jgi:hypothetical protein
MNAFMLVPELSIEEKLAGIRPLSLFELSCRSLGIGVIAAHSPQTKGRVERNHDNNQYRFDDELRLTRTSRIEEANRFPQATYLPAINERFAKQAAHPEDAYAPLVNKIDMRDIFCFKEQRVVSRDWVVQFERHVYQIPSQVRGRPAPGQKVVVRKWLDASVHWYWRERPLPVRELPMPKGKEAPASRPA